MTAFYTILVVVVMVTAPGNVLSNFVDQFALEDGVKIEDSSLGAYGGDGSVTVDSITCALYAVAQKMKAFQVNPATGLCQTIPTTVGKTKVSKPGWKLYVLKQKKTACVTVAVDQSESLDKPDHLKQESDFLDATFAGISSQAHLDAFDTTFTIVPFNVVPDEAATGSIASTSYADRRLFVAAGAKLVKDLMDDIKAKGTRDLTDISAVVDYVAGLGCTADERFLFIVSDFIVTKNPKKLETSLQAITGDNFKVIAVGLNKERVKKYFDDVGRVSGHKLDLKDVFTPQLIQILNGSK